MARAIVGDNEIGKTTLVKLLAGLYLPTQGQITVDRADLTSVDPAEWRERISASFQDRAHFETLERETVGIGPLTDPDHHRVEQTIRDALERAGATYVLAAVPNGVATQLGSRWAGGTDVSSGLHGCQLHRAGTPGRP